MEHEQCADEQTVQYLDLPIKSVNDIKHYRVIKLKNGLIALLISDLERDMTHESDQNKDTLIKKMAACGLCIDVGSFSDPIEVQGTAHLLEHAIHLASKNYSERGGYERYIKSRGGSIHAETGSERTKYLFDIQPSHLLPAMDRIANFLAAPLIDQESVLRECQAVDNEFLLESSSGSELPKRLFRIIPNSDHPASKFSCGNLSTLRDNVDQDTLRSTLIEFWKRHYSAHRMRLVVQASLPLDVLENYVTQCFAIVPTNKLPADEFTRHSSLNSINPKKLRKIYKIKPIYNTCELHLKWVLPPLRHSYKTKPLNYISRLIDREEEGSLSHYLRGKKLCSRVSTSQELHSIYSSFTLHLVLCDENTRIDNVLEAVFCYINMLRREGLQEKVYAELRQIAENQFKYAEVVPAAANIRNLCCDMHLYPPMHYITGNQLYFEYDTECIQSVLDCLTPNNVFIVHANKKFDEGEFDQVEQWYGIKYSVDEIPEDWIKRWKDIDYTFAFTMPQPNLYVPTDFSLMKLSNYVSEYPIKIKDDEEIKIWYKADSKYRLPHCYVYLRLISRLTFNSVNCCIMTRLFEILLHELLLERLYDAKCAGFTYSVSADDPGLLIRVNGFNQNILVVLRIIVECVAQFNVLTTQKLFNLAKTQLLNYYSSVLYDPEALASEIQSKTIEPNFWMSNEKNAALLNINSTQFLNFSKRLTNNLQIESLVQGNITPDEALKLICKSIGSLKLSTSRKTNTTDMPIHHLPVGEMTCRMKNLNYCDINSVVINFYQTDVEYSTFSLPVFKEFLEFLIDEPLFYQLRTVEQLGYEVSFAGSASGFIISVHSPIKKFSTERINERIESFITEFVDTLSRMTDEEFNAKKRHFVQSRVISDVMSQKNEADRNWFAISCKIPFFDERPERISAINNLTIGEVRQWLVDRVVVGGKQFRKLSVQVEGNIDNSSSIFSRMDK